MIVYPFLLFLTIHMLFVFDTSSQDRMFVSTDVYDNSNPIEGIGMIEGGKKNLDFNV